MHGDHRAGKFTGTNWVAGALKRAVTEFGCGTVTEAQDVSSWIL